MRVETLFKRILSLPFSETCEKRHLPRHISRILFHSKKGDACGTCTYPLHLPVKDEATLYLHVSIAFMNSCPSHVNSVNEYSLQ